MEKNVQICDYEIDPTNEIVDIYESYLTKYVPSASPPLFVLLCFTALLVTYVFVHIFLLI